MHGTWTVTATRIAPIHTFTAPEEGWLVNSHIIELPSAHTGDKPCVSAPSQLRPPFSR